MAYTLTYSYASQAYTVTGYTGTPDNVVIPNTYNDGTHGEFPVTSIGEDAFSDCSSLTSITIPDSVTSIGDRAFWECSSLTSITIPDSVTSIGGGAFHNCRSLTSITIPNSVTSIGTYAFENCSSLTSITIPNSVTSIGWYAFSRCSSLTSITIPNSVTSIGWYAFSGCSILTNIILLPNTPPTLGTDAFSHVSANAKFYCHKSSENAYKTATNWNTYADKIIGDDIALYFGMNANSTKDYIDRKTIAGISLQDGISKQELADALGVSPDLNMGNGTINGTLTQKNLSYDQMMLDFEPNMVAYVSYIGAGVSSPTSKQLIALLNSDKTNPYVAAILGDYTFEQYCAGFLAGTGSIKPGVSNKTAIDALVADQLSSRWGVSSSDNLSNTFGAASDGAVAFGFKNKVYSPAAVTFGFDNQAGDEGYPSESIGAIAIGYKTKALGNQSFASGYNTEASGILSIATGFGTKALGNQSFAGGKETTATGEQSIAIGNGGECHIDGSTEDEKGFQRKYLTLLERAGGTVTGDRDSRIGLTGITKGSASQIFGHNLYNGSDYTTIIGNYNIADDGSPDTLITGLLNYAENSHRSLLYGYNNEVVNSSGAIAGGESNKITNCYAGLVSGYHNEANAPGQVIMGANNKGSSTKRYQVILGKWSAVNDDALLVVGNGTWEGGRSNLLEIYPDSVMFDGLVGASKIQAGIGSKASGLRTIAVGGNAIATGDEAAAFGTSVTASGPSSIAMGRQSTSSGLASVALGYYVNASGQGQVVIGNFNDNVSSNIFEVGNGTDTYHRSNAFEIGQDGVARAYGTPSESYDLTPKKYVDDAINTKQDKPSYEIKTIQTTDWTALSSSTPYTYSATVSATATISANTIVELVNDNPILFATYGFAIASVSGQNITIYSVGTPATDVSLKIGIGG